MSAVLEAHYTQCFVGSTALAVMSSLGYPQCVRE